MPAKKERELRIKPSINTVTLIKEKKERGREGRRGKNERGGREARKEGKKEESNLQLSQQAAFFPQAGKKRKLRELKHSTYLVHKCSPRQVSDRFELRAKNKSISKQ